jgi:hypothetical protein
MPHTPRPAPRHCFCSHTSIDIGMVLAPPVDWTLTWPVTQDDTILIHASIVMQSVLGNGTILKTRFTRLRSGRRKGAVNTMNSIDLSSRALDLYEPPFIRRIHREIKYRARSR